MKGHSLRVPNNRELRRIFGTSKMESRKLYKLQNDELHNLYSSQNNIKVAIPRMNNEMDGECCSYERERYKQF
jgi:hypothetical protein